MDIEHFGEKALLEYKDQRELRERLFDVDEQLSNLSNRDEDEVSGNQIRLLGTEFKYQNFKVKSLVVGKLKKSYTGDAIMVLLSFSTPITPCSVAL